MSSHVVTLRNAILEARAALTGATALTDLVPERSITFGNSPQKDLMPRIVIEVSSAEYEATFTQSRKVQTFTVEYAVYSKSVDTCTAIMDEVRQALDTYQSSDFSVRVTDESFQAEVDNVLLGVVVATFQDAHGIPGFDASAAETLAAVQEDLAQAQTDLAAAQASEQALQDQLDAINNPPAFNATGQPGETTGALWSLRVLAEGYTGPVVQVANYTTLTGYTFSEVVDVYEADLGNYYIENGWGHFDANNQDGKKWVVTRIYDQIGTNDLVWDIAELEDSGASMPTMGPRIAFDGGAYCVVNAVSTSGFVSEDAVRYDNFTCTVEAGSGTHGTGSAGREVYFGGAKHPIANTDYRYFAIQTWNSNSASGLYRHMVGNGTIHSDVSTTQYLVEPSFAGNIPNARQSLALSRQAAEATAVGGPNLFHSTDAWAPAENASCRVGWAHNNYNPAAGIHAFFWGAAYMEGTFKSAVDLNEAAYAFSDAIGNRHHRQILTNS